MGCPVCKQHLHLAMADRYSGCCSQGCEAIKEVNELDAALTRLREENAKLKNTNLGRLLADRDEEIEQLRGALGIIAHNHAAQAKHCMNKTWSEALAWAQKIARTALEVRNE